ncbi:MAG: AAA family ATPase [Desulfovibrio sp.]|uniref:P-loop NTPase fold protein n=1 Tax=Desulfovibrio sp. TaxID=885 RepID=UPI001A6C5EA6|nr:P-loop NTPase fold protein [Desulfovibrio sp.]MBD5416996.1 AAA family ATPase [Desulfovibrio sp.]
MVANFGKNQMVADTLDAYLQQNKPRFAVQLQGKWGSGKTWFIRKYIDKKDIGNQPFCYVSLFGIEQLKEIDSQILSQTNKILAKSQLLSRLAGDIIEKCTPAINRDNIDKLWEFLRDLCKIPKNLVLVLDDLERSRIPLDLVLGYVSDKLDQVGIKVILLCDQEQIPDQEKEKFSRFKEKVVGSTIAVIPDAETVYNYQIELIPDPNIRKIFQQNKRTLIKDFMASKTDNLRSIKKIIYEFSMCYKYMTEDMQTNYSFINEFLHVLFIFSIENNKSLKNIEDYRNNKNKIYIYYERPEHYSRPDAVTKDDEWWYAQLSSEYSKFIEKFFYNGIIDEVALMDSYVNLGYSKDSEIPLIIYHKFQSLDIDESEMKDLYSQLQEDIKNHKYTDPSVILHAFDIMLKFNQIGLDGRQSENIKALANEYLEEVKFFSKPFKLNEFEAELLFLSGKTDSFRAIYHAVCHRITELHTKKMNTFIKKSSQLLPDNPDKFIARFSCKRANPASFTDLNARDFAQRVTKVHVSKLRKIMEIIYFNITHTNNKLHHNILWYKEFCNALKDNLNSMSPLARYTLDTLIVESEKILPPQYPEQLLEKQLKG